MFEIFYQDNFYIVLVSNKKAIVIKKPTERVPRAKTISFLKKELKSFFELFQNNNKSKACKFIIEEVAKNKI